MTTLPPRLLHETLARTAKTSPDKIAIVAGGERLTYGALWAASQGIANALRTNGVRRGDRVAIVLDNSWQCAAALYGALLADAVFVVINPQTSAENLAYILNDSGATALVSDSRFARIVMPAAESASALRVVIGDGLPGRTPPGTSGLDLSQALESNHGVQQASAAALSIDLCALIYTSGSTGSPKGVMHTHDSMLFSLYSLVEYQRIEASDRLLCVLPLAFGYGMFQLLMAVHVGATLVLEGSFAYPAQVFDVMRAEGVTVFPAVPTVFAVIVAAHDREPLCFKQVRLVTNAAAGLPPHMNSRLREVFPNADIFRMYGQTECFRISYLPSELMDEKPESVGIAIPGTEVMVLNEDGQPVAPGESGTLFVRGAHVMRGYWNQPEQTAVALKPGPVPGERWLCTNDLFRLDEDGMLYFVSRTDDVFKSRGEKVSPWEVESALCSMEGIGEAAVIGVPDSLLGLAVHAFISPKEGACIKAFQIKKACSERLDPHMVPKYITVLDELPKSTNGKILKKQLLTDTLARNP